MVLLPSFGPDGCNAVTLHQFSPESVDGTRRQGAFQWRSQPICRSVSAVEMGRARYRGPARKLNRVKVPRAGAPQSEPARQFGEHHPAKIV
jgi:hypothetical protein